MTQNPTARTCIALLFFCCFARAGHAQNWTVGLFAGAQQSRVVSEAPSLDYAEPSPAYGPLLGFRAGMKVAEGVYLRGGLNYGLYGGRFEQEYRPQDSVSSFIFSERLLQAHYLGLSLVLAGRFPVSEQFRLQGFAGAEPALLLSASQREQIDYIYTDGTKRRISSPVENISEELNGSDVAALVGAGGAYRLAPDGNAWLSAELRYAGGFSDLDSAEGRNPGAQRRRGLALVLGLTYDLP